MNNLLEAAVQSFRGWNIFPKERISFADIPGTSSALTASRLYLIFVVV